LKHEVYGEAVTIALTAWLRALACTLYSSARSGLSMTLWPRIKKNPVRDGSGVNREPVSLVAGGQPERFRRNYGPVSLDLHSYFERRCTITRLADWSNAVAFGIDSTAFSTIGSASTAIRRVSSAPNAVAYSSLRRFGFTQSLF
jgi:hypothetical protein